MGLLKMLFTVWGEPMFAKFGKQKKMPFLEKIKLGLKYKTLVFCMNVSEVSALLLVNTSWQKMTAVPV